MIPGVTLAYSDAQTPDAFDLKNNLTAVGLKVMSTFQNGNLFGTYLALLLPIPAALFHSARGWRKQFYLLLLGLAMANLLLSLSRGAIVAGMVSLGVLSLILHRATALRIVALLLVAVGGVLVYALQLGERLLVFDPTLAGRIPMYQVLASVYDSLDPLSFCLAATVGIGMGSSIGPAIDRLQIVDSSLMAIAMKMGLVGLLSLGTFIYAVFGFAWHRCRASQSLEGSIGCALAAGVVGASVQFAIDGVIMLPPTAMNFWMVAGLALAAGSIAREPAEKAWITG